MKKLLAALALAVGGMALNSTATANTGGPALDRFPVEKLQDLAALQDGAKTFVNYCMGCHSASAVRFNRLKDIGLTEDLIKANLMFTTDKIGDQMTIAMRPASAKGYFGVVPPDLSLTARARASGEGSGPDWIYTYLRSFYRDAGRPTGWNNVVFPNVGMPHVLWNLQGARTLKTEEVRHSTDPKTGAEKALKITTTYDEFGLSQSKQEDLAEAHAHDGTTYEWTDRDPARAKAYDDQVGNLVAYMAWMADPTKSVRQRLGVIVLLFLAVFTVFAWGLNRSYWKDIK